MKTTDGQTVNARGSGLTSATREGRRSGRTGAPRVSRLRFDTQLTRPPGGGQLGIDFFRYPRSSYGFFVSSGDTTTRWSCRFRLTCPFLWSTVMLKKLPF